MRIDQSGQDQLFRGVNFLLALQHFSRGRYGLNNSVRDSNADRFKPDGSDKAAMSDNQVKHQFHVHDRLTEKFQTQRKSDRRHHVTGRPLPPILLKILKARTEIRQAAMVFL